MKINEIEEEQKSRFWTIALRVSTIAVICIGIFFIVKLFTTNPLEGKWAHQDSNLVLNIPDKDEETDDDTDLNDTLVMAGWTDENSGKKIETGYDFTVDFKEKTITLKLNEEAFSNTVNENEKYVSESSLRSSADSLEGTYTYSISMRELTLDNVKYDGAMVFDKK